MSKPPNKGGPESTASQKPPTGNPYNTRAAALTANGSRSASQQRPTNTEPAKTSQSGKAKNKEPGKDAASATHPMLSDLLQVIEEALLSILDREKMEQTTRTLLGGVLMFIRETVAQDQKSKASVRTQSEVSDLHKAIKLDLFRMYDALAKQLTELSTTANSNLTNSAKTLKDTEVIKDTSKDIIGKLSKVTDNTGEIMTTTKSYRNALVANPAATNKAKVDPRVLGDLERKAKQILIELFDEEGNSTIDKSLTELLSKANKVLDKIEDADKPDEVKVEAVLKTRKGELVLTLNSKEAAAWIKQPEIEMAFTDDFAKGAHVRERNYNLIVPRIPVVFDPENKSHLRETEEGNGLHAHSIRKARWIKPIGRRRPDQTHAYAILSISSADVANLLIRDGLKIFGNMVRPVKQKQEPMQCMKCRRWGHFAGECPETEDTCGTCGESHRTNNCTSRSKVYCATCKDNTHASWNRACLEFNRRSAIIDERNPGNSMPYFPTEQDWTFAVRPNRIPLEERFPAKFAVNNLPIGGAKNSNARTRAPRKPDQTLPPRPDQTHANRQTGRQETGNPNLIPLPVKGKNRIGGTGEPSETDDSEGWMQDIDGPTTFDKNNGWTHVTTGWE
jgi:hypothetical protein